MRRMTLPTMSVLAAMALVFAAFTFVQAQPAAPVDHFTLPGLQGIPQGQLFSHFRGATINMTDKNGAQLVVKVTPGTVSTVNSTTIVITPNGQTSKQSFNITANTVIHGVPKAGSLEAIAPGDQVVVVTEGNSSDAVLISKHMMRGQMMSQPGTTNR